MRACTIAICLAPIWGASPAGAGQKEDLDALHKLMIAKLDNQIATSGEWKPVGRISEA